MFLRTLHVLILQKQQMAPPPPPGLQTPMGISAASETSDAQLAESQSPELLTPKNAQTPKGGAKARARGGTGRGTRRRKASNAPIKDESDVWSFPCLRVYTG